jgi:hypothetical protein
LAKVSKVNVAITGDAKGLTRAGDQATAQMRRIRAQADATAKQMGQFRGQADLLASSLGKLGMVSPALGGLGGVLGLGQSGIGAIFSSRLGVTFAALAAGAIVVDKLNENYKALARAAKEANRAMESGVSTERQWRELGFTKAGGEALARYGRQYQPPISFESASLQVQAMEATAGKGWIQSFMESTPAIAGAVWGSVMSGGASTQTQLNAMGQDAQSALGRGAVIPGLVAWSAVGDMMNSLKKWMSE